MKEQRETIKKLTQNGQKEEQIENFLHKEWGNHAFHTSTIYKWMERTKTSPNDLEDQTREGRPIDEQLLNVIDQTLKDEPFSTIRSIAQTVNSNPATVYRYVTEYLKRIYRHTRWVPHTLTNEQKMHRVDESIKLLRLLKQCKTLKWKQIFTGDESIFMLHYGADGAWVAEDENGPIMDGSEIQQEKVMVTIIWGVSGFLVLDMLPENESFDSSYFIEHIITPFKQSHIVQSLKKSHKRVYLHLDNSRVHNSKYSHEKIESAGIFRAPQPAYSPDISPSDYFLFGYIKGKLKGKIFKTRDELFEAIYEILNSISKEKLIEVFESWIKRCKDIINRKGNYLDD